jgi:hypothetical protein
VLPPPLSLLPPDCDELPKPEPLPPPPPPPLPPLLLPPDCDELPEPEPLPLPLPPPPPPPPLPPLLLPPDCGGLGEPEPLPPLLLPPVLLASPPLPCARANRPLACPSRTLAGSCLEATDPCQSARCYMRTATGAATARREQRRAHALHADSRRSIRG